MIKDSDILSIFDSNSCCTPQQIAKILRSKGLKFTKEEINHMLDSMVKNRFLSRTYNERNGIKQSYYGIIRDKVPEATIKVFVQ